MEGDARIARGDVDPSWRGVTSLNHPWRYRTMALWKH